MYLIILLEKPVQTKKKIFVDFIFKLRMVSKCIHFLY